MLFNIFVNYLIYEINNACSLYNYTGDDTLGFCHPDINILKTRLEEGPKIILNWFHENHMEQISVNFNLRPFYDQTVLLITKISV